MTSLNASDRRRRGESNVTLWVPMPLKDKLRDEAAARSMSMNTFVQRLIEEGLERLIPVEERRLTR